MKNDRSPKNYKVVKTKTNIRLKAIYNDPNFEKDALAFLDYMTQLLLARNIITSTDQVTFCNRKVVLLMLGEKPVEKLDSLLSKY